jgi:hypothetical protein
LNKQKAPSLKAGRSFTHPSPIWVGSASSSKNLLSLLLAHRGLSQNDRAVEEPQYPWFAEAPQSSDENMPDMEKHPVRHAEMDSEELLAWAFANRRFDILAEFGIYPPSSMAESKIEDAW